ncbi:hypothetical protein M426DRAFT_143162 [Hypoxylon sp. CI-4A]|nr:hypothetical protein M426DRAFT_143162 [Hypoxylon sp. CI-4A]
MGDQLSTLLPLPDYFRNRSVLFAWFFSFLLVSVDSTLLGDSFFSVVITHLSRHLYSSGYFSFTSAH